MSAETILKNTRAAAVRTSNAVHGLPSAAMASTSVLTTPSTCSRSLSSISDPPILMLSLTLRISGEVNIPTEKPEARRMESIMAQTDPFPSVPATCIRRMPSWGRPSLSRSSISSSRPSLIPLLDNPAYHAVLGPNDI